MGLPIGFAYDGNSRLVLDPDRQVQNTVRLLIDTFRETGSACAVLRRMRAQNVLFPRLIRRGIGKGDLLWGALNHSRVIQLLQNLRYAGAFVSWPSNRPYWSGAGVLLVLHTSWNTVPGDRVDLLYGRQRTVMADGGLPLASCYVPTR